MEHSITRRDFVKTAAAAAGTLAAAASAAREDSAGDGELLLGVQYRMLPQKMPDREKFALAKACGYQGVEAEPMADLEAAKIQAREAREAGTPIHSVTYGGWKALFSEPDAALVRQGLADFELALRQARAMDADVVLLVPARVGPTVRYGEAYERSQAGIRAALPLAEELGVTIAVENVWNNFLLSPLEFARYIDEFGSPRVKAYFDVGNIIKYGWAQDWILTLGERIVRLHWKDYDRKSNEWKALGEGSVDWPETRQALRDIGFRGFGTVEMKAGDEAYLRDICERMKAIGRGERPSAA